MAIFLKKDSKLRKLIDKYNLSNSDIIKLIDKLQLYDMTKPAIISFAIEADARIYSHLTEDEFIYKLEEYLLCP